MKEFKRITLEDRDILAQYLEKTPHQACDYTPGNLILWSRVYHTEYAVEDGVLYIKFGKGGKTFFGYPMGVSQEEGALKKAFAWLEDYCKEEGLEMNMTVVEPSMYERIRAELPGIYDIEYMRDNADYIYDREALATLAGKKYHGKKNHVNKFLKTYTDWSYESIDLTNRHEAIDMVSQWCAQNGCCEDAEKAMEVCLLIEGLGHMDRLHFRAGLLRAGGRVVAMAMGEPVNDEMFVVHFEKAFSDVDGAYPMINQQFVIHEMEGFRYVNREEDLGMEGLRRAKESYKPVMMGEKGWLIRRA